MYLQPLCWHQISKDTLHSQNAKREECSLTFTLCIHLFTDKSILTLSVLCLSQPTLSRRTVCTEWIEKWKSYWCWSVGYCAATYYLIWTCTCSTEVIFSKIKKRRCLLVIWAHCCNSRLDCLCLRSLNNTTNHTLTPKMTVLLLWFYAPPHQLWEKRKKGTANCFDLQ